ncbi:MAG: MogA/MoaB family molybdenum cofactor biosynthesis protein [Nitrospinota bacterium]|nr:MogA/MoaB family molybdenum cofactor biosynthesis protein [Nitrospinota bacterium]
MMDKHHTKTRFPILLLVISDRAHRRQRQDLCQAAIVSFLAPMGRNLAATKIVPDEVEAIQVALLDWAGAGEPAIILTAGGTGLSPRDVTPEATRPLLDREIPGLPEAMRAASMRITPYAALSRGWAGFIKNALVLNLPGSPKAAVENLSAVFAALDHAVEKAMGDPSDCQPPPAAGA